MIKFCSGTCALGLSEGSCCADFCAAAKQARLIFVLADLTLDAVGACAPAQPNANLDFNRE